MSSSPIERFWARVRRSDPDRCWEWQGFRFPKGYGQSPVRLFGTRYAHRISNALSHGALPGSGVVRHKCDNPPCVNPAHLIEGSYSENNRDMYGRGRGGYRGSPGSKNAACKLTVDQIREIRQRARAGERQADIGAAFGIAQSHVSRIARGEAWTEATVE